MALSLSLLGCGTTFLDKSATAQVTTTSVLQAIESGTKAGLLTKADAQNLLKQVDIAEEGVKLAPTLGDGSADRLTQSRTVLLAVQQYLLKKGVK